MQSLEIRAVMKFGHGEMGPTSGMAAHGSILTNAEAKEVWVGTTLGYADS